MPRVEGDLSYSLPLLSFCNSLGAVLVERRDSALTYASLEFVGFFGLIAFSFQGEKEPQAHKKKLKYCVNVSY